MLQKYLLNSLNHIHIWQVSPQLSCGDTCQVWMLHLITNVSFDNVERFRSQRNGGNWLSNPHPRTWWCPCFHCCWWVHTLAMITRYAWHSHFQSIKCRRLHLTNVNDIYVWSKYLNMETGAGGIHGVSVRFPLQETDFMIPLLLQYPAQTIEQTL